MGRPRKTLKEKILSAYKKGYNIRTIAKRVGASESYTWQVIADRRKRR